MHIDPLLRIEVERVDRRAVVRVHQQALALADLRDDRVAGNRPATRRELHRQALGAADGDGVEAVLAVGGRFAYR